MFILARPRRLILMALVVAAATVHPIVAPVAAQTTAPAGAACPATPDCKAVACVLQRDERDCSIRRDATDCFRCVISGFGHCIQHANDPACEAVKAKSNVDTAARTAACETARAAQNAAYEIAFQACLNRQLKCELSQPACAADGAQRPPP